MPLKGLILRTLYPKPELRQMCDNDILFDSAAAGKLHRFMTSRGYRAEDGWLYDRSYKKEPCFHFELHKTLLSPLSGAAELYPHYKNVHERLLPVPGTRCEMTFRDEDFYLYLLVHARKHDLEWEAIGLRMALDLKLYLDRKEPALDWRYIDRQLDLMRMRDFAGDLRNLAMRLFSPSGIQELDADGTAMLERLAGSDIYGHDKAARERSIARQLQRAESGRVRFPKLTYMMARLFPPARQMREIFSPCEKWPFLLPLAYLLRFGTCLRQSRRFLREVRQVITSRG